MTDTTENKAQPKRQLHLRQKRGIRQKEFSFSQVALSLKVTQSCLTRARPFPSPGEPSPGTEPGSTALKAGFLSHQGNSNQQKKEKKKPICQYPRPGFRPWGAKNLASLFAQPYPIGHPVSLEKPHCDFMDMGLPLCLSWKRIRLQCGRPGFHPWVGKIPAKGEG